jgi:hypothetical protein
MVLHKIVHEVWVLCFPWFELMRTAAARLRSCLKQIVDKFVNTIERKTRSKTKGDLTIPLFKTNSGQKTFYYRGVTLWNALSFDVRNSSSVEHFKKHFLNHIYFSVYQERFNLDTLLFITYILYIDYIYIIYI